MEQEKDQTTEQKQQSWLAKLAAESYQAELIVSGIAIVGVSLLPGLIDRQIDWILLSINADYFIFYYFVFTYLSFGVGMLYVSLIFHFLARTLWIGMVGLQSVFPKGINYDNMEHLSKDYREKMRKDLPDFQSFIEQLDRFCSMIFAFSFGLALVMVSIAVVITVILGITGLLKWIIPALSIKTTAICIMIISFSPLLFGSLLNLEILREKKWVQRFHYPLMITISKILYNINYLPLTYIMGVFTSNYKLKKVGIVYMATIILISFFTIVYVIGSTNILDLAEFSGETKGYRSDRIESFEYEDQLKEGESILTAVIPSDQINTAYLRLFVPIPERMEEPLKLLCGEWEASSENLDRETKRKERRAFRLDCLHRYFKVSLDEVALQNVSWSFYKHPNAGEEGIITYLPTSDWSEGKHILTIVEKETSKEEDPRKQRVVFWFEKR